jgi:uncharacterized protein (DUF488 family)
MKFLTMGYEGLTSQQFFQVLLKNKVETIVDIRELPLSRKVGFSKKSLAQAAGDYCLEYVHLAALGSPRDIRHDYWHDNDWQRFTRRYKSYLKTQEDSIRELSELIKRERCCLLCFEADHNFCHRIFVAEQLVAKLDGSVKVVHLTPPNLEKAVLLRPALV